MPKLIQSSPWLNHVRNWAPSNTFIRQIKDWYPSLDVRGYAGLEGWLIGHNHATSGRGRTAISAADAHVLLIKDLIKVQICMESTILCEISEGQYMAIMSWIFDIGEDEWRSMAFASLLLQGRDYEVIRHLSAYTDRNGQIEMTRTIRRAQEVTWWSLT